MEEKKSRKPALKDIREKYDLSILVHKEIFTIEETMVFFNISWDFIMKEYKFFDFPVIDKGRGNRFCKKRDVEKWFSNQIKVG